MHTMALDKLAATEPCDTCGGTNRHETTLEDAPGELVDLGPCPDCDPYNPTDPVTFYDKHFNYRGPVD